MAKADVISAGVAAIQSAEAQALSDQLGIAYDAGATDQKASDGSFTQADIDAAVKSATDPLSAQVASVQASLDALTAKEQLEEASVADLQSKIDGIKAILGS